MGKAPMASGLPANRYAALIKGRGPRTPVTMKPDSAQELSPRGQVGHDNRVNGRFVQYSQIIIMAGKVGGGSALPEYSS